MSDFDWSVCVVKNSIDLCFIAVWFDSNAVKVTTVERHLTSFLNLNFHFYCINHSTGIILLKK